ncbi:MAG: hypothetical protein ACHQO8_11070, partial [Vicinamibacterales bacterium]
EIKTDGFAVAVVEWQRERLVIVGRDTLKAIGLDGSTRFELPLGDFVLREATTVRLGPDARPHLAIVGAPPRNDVQRWRLLVLSPARAIVYEEIFDVPVRLLTARRGDGRDTLLLAGAVLRALQPGGEPAVTPRAQPGTSPAPSNR